MDSPIATAEERARFAVYADQPGRLAEMRRLDQAWRAIRAAHNYHWSRMSADEAAAVVEYRRQQQEIGAALWAAADRPINLRIDDSANRCSLMIYTDYMAEDDPQRPLHITQQHFQDLEAQAT